MDKGERLSELLEVQEQERRNLIGKTSHEYFLQVCKNQEQEIFKLINNENATKRS